MRGRTSSLRAIVFALEAFRPYSDMCDLKELLNDTSQPLLELFQTAAREQIDVLQGRTL
jgi:hypothetical protein